MIPELPVSGFLFEEFTNSAFSSRYRLPDKDFELRYRSPSLNDVIKHTTYSRVLALALPKSLSESLLLMYGLLRISVFTGLLKKTDRSVSPTRSRLGMLNDMRFDERF
jgi:hypothetical protein